MKKLIIALTLGAALSASAQTTLSNAKLKQDPQSRIVEITYDLAGPAPSYYITVGIETNGVPIPDPVTLGGDVTTPLLLDPIVPGTGKKIFWNAKKDWPGELTTDARAVVTAWFTDDPPAVLSTYVVFDLSGGPSAPNYPKRYSVLPPNLSDDTCRTTELWLRRIPKGTFTMGSPAGELGRQESFIVWGCSETQHEVTLTKDFYIGVFTVTQKQWDLVMGGINPSTHPGDTRPVETVSYDMIRGSGNGAQYPASNQVDAGSFMGVLRTKTLLTFDLPTEAQWEYACRAGTTNALNSDKNLSATYTFCPNMAEVGRYDNNKNDGKGGYNEHTKVGCYAPNAWGLYDMHGNILENCLDRFQPDLGGAPVSDPTGAGTFTDRSTKGGTYVLPAFTCRSAWRLGVPPTLANSTLGFRACIQP